MSQRGTDDRSFAVWARKFGASSFGLARELSGMWLVSAASFSFAHPRAPPCRVQREHWERRRSPSRASRTSVARSGCGTGSTCVRSQVLNLLNPCTWHQEDINCDVKQDFLGNTSRKETNQSKKTLSCNVAPLPRRTKEGQSSKAIRVAPSGGRTNRLQGTHLLDRTLSGKSRGVCSCRMRYCVGLTHIPKP